MSETAATSDQATEAGVQVATASNAQGATTSAVQSAIGTPIDGQPYRATQSEPTHKHHKANVGGVRVFTLTIVFFIISFALCVGAGIETVNVSQRYETLEQASDLAALCEEAVSQAGNTSDLLTAESRLFATTGNVVHAKNYFDESERNKQREHSLDTVRQNYDDPAVVHLLEDAMQKSNDLMNTEEYSMVLMLKAQGLVPGDVIPELEGIELKAKDEALSADAKKALSAEILFNQAYAHDKGAIDEEVAEVLERVTLSTDKIRERESEDLESSLQAQQIFIMLLVVMVLVSSLVTIFLVVVPLRTNTKRLEKDERLELKGSYELRYMSQTYNDIYDFKLENEALLRDRANHDPLTGALNRGAFDRALEELEDTNTPICLAIVDVDNFKQVNDSYGHSMGDKVLCFVGELLINRFRSTDIVARIGGDEFAVIAVGLPLADSSIIKLKIENICERLANPRGDICPVTISVGCAFSEGYDKQLFDQADKALYSVKESGRNGFAIYKD